MPPTFTNRTSLRLKPSDLCDLSSTQIPLLNVKLFRSRQSQNHPAKLHLSYFLDKLRRGKGQQVGEADTNVVLGFPAWDPGASGRKKMASNKKKSLIIERMLQQLDCLSLTSLCPWRIFHKMKWTPGLFMTTLIFRGYFLKNVILFR